MRIQSFKQLIMEMHTVARGESPASTDAAMPSAEFSANHHAQDTPDSIRQEGHLDDRGAGPSDSE